MFGQGLKKGLNLNCNLNNGNLNGKGFSSECNYLQIGVLFSFVLALVTLIFSPDLAMAKQIGLLGQGGTSGIQAVMDTITGPVGKTISIVAMAICGVMFIMQKDDLSGGIKLLLSVVFGISFIAFSGSIIEAVFPDFANSSLTF